jgi:hypothetical protein
MTGQVFPTDEIMGTHVNCRCTMVPLPPTWVQVFHPDAPADLPELATVVPDGETAFAHLSPAEQQEILGPVAYREYTAGRITLSQLVHVAHSAEWGTTRTTASLRSLGVSTTV